MDQIAIISDIHGNLPALEATLADIRQRDIQLIYCLGDLVGKGPESAKVVDLCREVCQAVVKGNWDAEMHQPTTNHTRLWHQTQLGRARLDYLRHLPNIINFQMSGKRVRLFHASAHSLYQRVDFWDKREQLRGMFANTAFTTYEHPRPEIVGYGDIHLAFQLPVHDKILFNVGSVGNPLDCIPLACYAIVKGNLHSTSYAPFTIEIVRVAYDIERAIADARALNMPKLAEYAFELRHANHRSQMVTPRLKARRPV
jgi:protein phosphatase